MKKNPPLLAIVIPCLNERATIKAVLDQATHYAAKLLSPKDFELIVADNGSTDGTLEILKRYKGIRLVKVPIRGYGAALHWGILDSSAKYVIFADADLSYPFSNLKLFLRKLVLDPDMVLGSRLKGQIEPKAMPFLNRYFGTPLLTILIRFLYHIPTSDCNSGMRLIRREFYKSLNMRNSGMEWASELLLKTALKNGKYFEVPILFKKDKRNKPPHMSRWTDGWRHLKAIMLLKPISIIYLTELMGLLAIVTFGLGLSFAITSLFILLFVVLAFSFLALMFLSFAINGKHNQVSLILNSNRLVSWVIMASISLGGIILALPESRLGTKLILVAILAVLFMWTFLVETIKTHMINPLPTYAQK